jgi:hypothetical protein
MSIRTTVTFDDDVLVRVKEVSRLRGVSFREAINELLRVALVEQPVQTLPPFRVEPMNMGFRPELNYDDTEALLEYAEGPYHR